MELFFDTETTGKPKRYDAPVSDVDNFPRLVQIGFIVVDNHEVMYEAEFIVKPDGFEIPKEVSAIHGITTEDAILIGFPIEYVIKQFAFWLENCDTVIGHNVSFNIGVVGSEYWRMYQNNPFEGKKTICTMKSSVQFCKLPGGRPFKYPKLSELYMILFGREMGAAHTALQDIQNTVECYLDLVKKGVIS